MSGIDVNAVLALRTRIVERAGSISAPAAPAKTEFESLLERSIATANDLSAKAGAASTDFETGATTDIASVMLARQESALAFRMALETRNKVLGAYRDIMSLPL
jgi:flagellar hook-basal body complex protein FliE